MKPKTTTTEAEISIIQVSRATIEFNILGTSPLIMNRVGEKARRELLLPRKKTAADKAGNLKHNPPEEYRASAYKSVSDTTPTRLLMPTLAFKGAMRSVAVDIPGAAKAQIGRLTYVEGDYVSIYGIPKAFLTIVRSADMNRTPDVRTRAILPTWAARFSVTYAKPLLNEQTVANLLAAAGLMRGVGDFRQEKGGGSYGCFELVGKNDERFAALIKAGGRVAQDAALENPEPYDTESAELLTWFDAEATRRGFAVCAA